MTWRRWELLRRSAQRLTNRAIDPRARLQIVGGALGRAVDDAFDAMMDAGHDRFLLLRAIAWV